MSTDTPGRSDEPDTAQKITLTLSEDEKWWVARDEETGVASQGRTRDTALDNLDEAIAGYHGEGTAPTGEELREIGIDPENNESGSIEIAEILLGDAIEEIGREREAFEEASELDTTGVFQE